VLAYCCLTPPEREASLCALSDTNIHKPAAIYFQTPNNPQFEDISKSSSAAASVLAVACTGWSIPPHKREVPLCRRLSACLCQVVGISCTSNVSVPARHVHQLVALLVLCVQLLYQAFSRSQPIVHLRPSGAAAAASVLQPTNMPPPSERTPATQQVASDDLAMAGHQPFLRFSLLLLVAAQK